MNLIIDIGNSSAKVARFHEGLLEEHFRMSLKELEEFLATDEHRVGVERCIVSSTTGLNPSLLDKLREVDERVVVLSGATALPFIVDYKTPLTIGPDRLAAVAGAMKRWPGETVLVVDAGTCVTYDVLVCGAETCDRHNGNGVGSDARACGAHSDDEPNGEGQPCRVPKPAAHYIGGNIAPGLEMRLRAMNEHTSRLPLVDQWGEVPQLGYDTPTALRAGVMRGIQHEIEGYIDYINKEYGRVKVVLTGGDSLRLKSLLADDVAIDEHLVLYGLDYILHYNEQIS